MVEADKLEFAQVLQGVYTEVHQRPELTASALRVWWMALNSITIEDFRAAMSAHLRSSKFPPTPADIIALAAGTREDDARHAWYKVRGALSSVGQYNSVAFDDRHIHRAIVDIGGWPKLCQTPESELPFREKDFIAAYRIAAQRDGDYPPHLPGVFEIENAARGFKPKGQMIQLVGDAHAVSRVMIGGKATTQQRIGAIPLGDIIKQLEDSRDQ